MDKPGNSDWYNQPNIFSAKGNINHIKEFHNCKVTLFERS